ncbi:MAG: saccharopine dehydrogenase NADP-binding domain-containing protein [Nitrospirae bacterium]|nr:saccharopine dehydrogenase NADP-binding domain-containing protein [Nitrospirota bacterium]
MKIFVLGVGATGSLLIQLLKRQGHRISCGDRDPERARRFLGETSAIPVQQVNARNIEGIVTAAQGTQLLINACPAVFNKIILRAAVRLRAHYLDMAAHLTENPFQAEQLRFATDFQNIRRTAAITAGIAPGLTNLLIAASADLLDSVETVQVRLYEATESDSPVSQWSAEVAFDEAVSRPRLYRQGHFTLGQRFGGREIFRFPAPIGPVGVVLAAQDEVVTVPQVIPLRSMDAKIGGSDIDQLRRWYRQGKLRKSRGLVPSQFPRTPTPGTVHQLLHRGILHNARFAAAVVVTGLKQGRPTLIRWDATMPSLHLLRRRKLLCSPIAWATAEMAALFVKHFPRTQSGVHPPEAFPAEIRRAILRDAKSRGIQLVKRITALPPTKR